MNVLFQSSSHRFLNEMSPSKEGWMLRIIMNFCQKLEGNIKSVWSLKGSE